MLDWLQEHGVLLTWLTAASVVMFFASLLIAPAIAIRIPADYFAHDRRPPSAFAHRHPVIRVLFHVAKNVLGVVFVLAGLAMLVLPGQGILTILLGFLLLDFPGKYRFERWLLSRRRLLRAVNWLRRRYGRTPLRIRPMPST